jgi:predicted anti-sigma-YlaC factor YlaD
MLNCKEATGLMSQKMDRNLGLGSRMSLRFHLMMCSGCRNFSKQMQFLRQASRTISRRK